MTYFAPLTVAQILEATPPKNTEIRINEHFEKTSRQYSEEVRLANL